jgi:hypothetical protein
MERDTHVRAPLGEMNPKDLDYPFAYVEDEFPIDDIQVSVLKEYPLFGAGKFPDNIKKYYWIRKGEDGVSPWYALMSLDNGNYAFFKASSVKSGFCDGGTMSLKVCPYYDLIIKHGMTEEDYNLYLKETKWDYSTNSKFGRWGL